MSNLAPLGPNEMPNLSDADYRKLISKVLTKSVDMPTELANEVTNE